MWPSNNPWQNSPQPTHDIQPFSQPGFCSASNNQFNAYSANFQNQQNINNIFVSYNTYNNNQLMNFSNSTTIQNNPPNNAVKNTKNLTEKEKIEITRKYAAARRNGKNLTMAAQVLGVSRSTLNSWEDKYFDAKVNYSAQEKKMHVNRCREMMKQGYTMQFYADENGLIASTLGSWLQQY